MSSCPFCGSDIIEGADVCDECGQTLSHMYLHTPANSVERHLVTDRVRDLNPKHPLAVTSETSLAEVLKMMVANSIGSTLVVDGEKLVGVFSERDALLKVNADAAELGDRPVSQFMTENPETLENDTKIAFAVHRMDLGGYRHLPVVDGEGKLMGIISARDILRYLTDKMSAKA